MTRILVTGGSGFLGTNLVQALTVTHEVAVLDHCPPQTKVARWIDVDILDAEVVLRAIRDFAPHQVVHLAARTDLAPRSSVRDYRANTAGVSHVIDAVAASGSVERTIYASSRLVFGIHHRPRGAFDYAPSTAYGESKVLTESLVRQRAGAASPWIIVRPTSLWGPWFREPYRNFFEAIRKGRYVSPSACDAMKSFGYVKNAVYQLLALLSRDITTLDRRVFWLADYEPLSVAAWAEAIRREFGAPPIRTLPIRALQAVAVCGDISQRLGYANPPLTSFRLDNLVAEMRYDTIETEQVVGPLPYGMHDGVRDTVAWMNARPSL